MTREQLRYQIGLTLIKGVGPILAKNLIAYLGSAEAVFSEKKQNLARIPGIGDTLAAVIAGRTELLDRADKEIENARSNGYSIISFFDKGYPYRLKECSDSPVILYCRGNIDLNNSRFLAFVGTRNATDYGKKCCESIIENLAAQVPGLVVVSGLAYGMDITAHKAAIKYGLPTIGVVAHGLDRIYPAVHTQIAARMVENGAVLTEYPVGTEPDRPNFVQRNRIIAGLCDGSVIVETATRGGSLLTAEAANQYNREVLAVPGRIGDLKSEGCNELIKQNKAALIETAEDVIAALNWYPAKKSKHIQTLLFDELNSDEQNVMELLRQFETLQLNHLTLQLKLSVDKLLPLLLEMEFKGLLRCLPGNVYKAAN
jgi:DNA processing protein